MTRTCNPSKIATTIVAWSAHPLLAVEPPLPLAVQPMGSFATALAARATIRTLLVGP